MASYKIQLQVPQAVVWVVGDVALLVDLQLQPNFSASLAGVHYCDSELKNLQPWLYKKQLSSHLLCRY